MTVRIEIFGSDASEALHDLRSLADVLLNRPVPAVAEAVKTIAPVKAVPAPESFDVQDEQVDPETEELVEEPEGDVAVDADGAPFDPTVHTGTKTKAGLWRRKKGAGEATGTEQETASTSATSETATAAAGGPSATDDEDEFAAFREAAEKSDAADASAKASVPARKWTDADLGSLCNQAAQKLGAPAPIKELIAKFTPEGEVAHSRNIPEAVREEFAQAVEAKAGIEFAG